MAEKISKHRELYAFRPIESVDDALDSQRAGFGIGIILMITQALSALVVVFGIQDLEPDMDTTGYYVGQAIGIIIAGVLALWVWSRRSLIGAILITHWFVLEFSLKVASGTATWLTAVIILTGFNCAVLAFRGHAGIGRLRRAAQSSPEIFS